MQIPVFSRARLNLAFIFSRHGECQHRAWRYKRYSRAIYLSGNEMASRAPAEDFRFLTWKCPRDRAAPTPGFVYFPTLKQSRSIISERTCWNCFLPFLTSSLRR